MNRQEFIKIAVNHYSLYFKPQNEDVEKEIPLKCGESDTDTSAVIDFAKWIGYATFKRPEVNSDDVLQFLVGPGINAAEFWTDINKTVFYNGYIMGSAGIIKTMYISTDGKFYDHKHELIAENEDDYFDYLLTVEFDFHPVIKGCVYDALREAGWHEGRSVDVTELNDKYKEFNIFLSKAQLDFLKEFSGITVKNSANGYKCRFRFAKKILRDFSPNCNNIGLRCDDYSLCVIDSDAADFCHYIKPNGIITFCGISKGRTTLEGINHVIKDFFGWNFDIDEPMDPHCTFNNIESVTKNVGRVREYSVEQIKSMTAEKIILGDGTEIVFAECIAEWNSFYNCSSKCVGQRNILGDEQGDPPYFLFWTKERIKIVFRGGLFRSPEKLFHKFCAALRKFGYGSYDLS